MFLYNSAVQKLKLSTGTFLLRSWSIRNSETAERHVCPNHKLSVWINKKSLVAQLLSTLPSGNQMCKHQAQTVPLGISSKLNQTKEFFGRVGLDLKPLSPPRGSYRLSYWTLNCKMSYHMFKGGSFPFPIVCNTEEWVEGKVMVRLDSNRLNPLNDSVSMTFPIT